MPDKVEIIAMSIALAIMIFITIVVAVINTGGIF